MIGSWYCSMNSSCIAGETCAISCAATKAHSWSRVTGWLFATGSRSSSAYGIAWFP